ncbi:MAG TPA: glycosyl hydrolase family 28-related protein, partial [Jatrophihabitans sp.]|nr:glycosyl hydrolase family 28-related protein [Jatrophihabitans sp.]
GLGASPTDVQINGTIDVYNQCDPDGTNCVATNNFWRSLANLTINVTGPARCGSPTDFWATSQAASLRRVNLTGGNLSLMDYCSNPPFYASGGFIADSAFSGGTVTNGSQQQFLVRNSNLDGWSNGVWNQVFAGVNGAPAQSFPDPPYTTLPTSPLTREKPFLTAQPNGRFAVFVPAVQHDSVGPTWTAGPTAGRSVPLGRFFVADPTTPVTRINQALAQGKNLLLTPGVYSLDHTIQVQRPRTIVLGLGFPTLVPQDGIEAMRVANVPGVQLAGLIVDAGPQNSPDLVQLGCAHCPSASNPNDPTTVQDVYFRIGGATPGRATTALVVNSSDVVLDNVWAWRADHGAGVGWNQNVSDTGLIVNGNRVTAYGLFVEHFQKENVIWNGQHGTDIFFQNEMPYDVPSQSAWMQSGAVKGYPAFRINAGVQTFTGYGLGSYCFFNQGLDIHATEAFQTSTAPGVQLHDLLTVFLTGSGGIDSVVNGVGGPVSAANQVSDVVSYP